ncbi:MAG: class II histone deacetylase, partial [Caulobacterales bacterium]|nr:class II histone deacetylase [Caulobacterales bacterium]
MGTGLVWHELYMWHDTQTHAGILQPGLHLEPGRHFESAESKRRFKNVLDVSGLSKSLTPLEPAPASRAQIRAIHTEDYVTRLEAMNETGGDAGMLTPFGPGGVDIAYLSAGAVLRLVDAVLDGEVANGYSLNRPPGHHAMPDYGCGFCLFCNGAIAAEHLVTTRGLSRVAMVDWDVHHGNGAEAAFWSRPDVLTISVHQDLCFPPDSGQREKRGEGAGLGYNINAPLPPGSGVGAYQAVFDRIVLPALRAFRPDFILVPSGFDGGAF